MEGLAIDEQAVDIGDRLYSRVAGLALEKPLLSNDGARSELGDLDMMTVIIGPQHLNRAAHNEVEPISRCAFSDQRVTGSEGAKLCSLHNLKAIVADII